MGPASRRNVLASLMVAAVLPSLMVTAWCVHPIDMEGFLLVETVGELQTKLVEGNYTDGTICFDFPTYSVDAAGHRVHQFAGEPPEKYRLAYGSGFFAGGLVSTGGASGLKFVDELPFSAGERVDDGNGTFTVNIKVNGNMDVILEGKPFNGQFRLAPGKSWTLSYDIVREHQNEGDGCCNGSICKIEYIGSTTITNHGMWNKSAVEFGN
jgi:hypothetical protein